MRSELYYAAIRGDAAAVRSLISQGANAGEKDSNGYTPLFASAIEGYAEIVQILVDEGADLNHSDSGWGPAIINASLRGHNEVVKLLVTAGPEVRCESGVHGLMQAAASGHTQIVQPRIGEGLTDGEYLFPKAKVMTFDHAIARACRNAAKLAKLNYGLGQWIHLPQPPTYLRYRHDGSQWK